MGRVGLSIFVAIAFSQSAAWAAQDVQALEQQRRQAVTRAQDAADRGDSIQATLYSGEAAALTAELEWIAGRTLSAEAYWNEAIRKGWRGTHPSQKHPRTVPLPPPRVQEEPPKIELPEPEHPEPPPRPVPIPPPRIGLRDREPVPLWPYVASAPYAQAHNGAWYSLFGIPALESANVMPEGTWHLRGSFDYAETNFFEGSPDSRWSSEAHQETFALEYSVSDTLSVGARLSMGEVFERDNETIRVFEGGTQVVPTATRTFDMESLILRAKWAGAINSGDSYFMDMGLLGEVKFPIADPDNVLTSQTTDIALAGLFTRKFGNLSLHINLGLVIPLGDAEIFIPRFDDVNSFVTLGAGLSWMFSSNFSLGIQLEGNDSPFRDGPSVVDDGNSSFLVHLHYRATESAFLGVAIGHGLDDITAATLFSASLDFAF